MNERFVTLHVTSGNGVISENEYREVITNDVLLVKKDIENEYIEKYTVRGGFKYKVTTVVLNTFPLTEFALNRECDNYECYFYNIEGERI